MAMKATRRPTYAVVVGDRWGRCGSRREALRCAKEGGGRVYVSAMGLADIYVDWPTYIASAELLADYRPRG